MPEVQWGLLNGRSNDFQNALTTGLSMGQDLRLRQDQQAQQAAAAQKQAQADEASKLAATRAKAIDIAKMFDGVNDDATYQERLAAAQRLGIDTAGAPPQFDPHWVQENGAIMRFIAEKPEAVSAAGKQATDEGFQPGSPQFNDRVKQITAAEAKKTLAVQPGGGVAVYDTQTGSTNFAIVPNPGGAPTGSPARPGATIPQGAIDMLRKNPGLAQQFDAKYGQGASQTVLGGQPAGVAPFGP